MIQNKNHIDQLIMEKVMQVISPTDELQLQQLMKKDKSVQQQYELAYKKISDAAAKGKKPIDPEKGWQEIAEKITLKKQSNRWGVIVTTAAAILVFTFLSGSLYLLSKKTTQPTAKFVTNKNQLRLTLANGKTIALAGKQAVSGGGIALTNDPANRILHYHPLASNTAGQAQMNTLSVPPGEDYKIELIDGTIVTLNSATTLKFPSAFSGKTREITINGEAYLKVAHNAQKPFIVHLPGSTIRVLGTQFNVSTYNKDTQKVSLIQGSLRFVAANQSLTLKPGEAAILNGQTLAKKPLNKDDLAWLRGEYVMNNTSIREIAQLLPRWFGIQVTLDNASIADKRFSGIIYKNKPIADFLLMLKGTTDADYYFNDEVLHLK